MQFEPIATTKVLDKGEVSLLAYCGSDASIAATARVSYSKGTKQVSSDEQLIRYLLRNHHTSPFEHTFIQFHVKAPIFVLRQWMRHRMWSYNEISGRYSELSNEAYLPMEEDLTTQDPKRKQVRTECMVSNSHYIRSTMEEDQENVFFHYNDMLHSGLAREVARINLPVATYSEVIMSVDLHNLLHFLSLRYSSHAQFEIRVYAEAIYEMLRPLFPATFAAWEACSLHSVTLTQPQLEALRVLVSGLAIGNEESVQDSIVAAVNTQHWVSSSEKTEILNILQSLVK